MRDVEVVPHTPGSRGRGQEAETNLNATKTTIPITTDTLRNMIGMKETTQRFTRETNLGGNLIIRMMHIRRQKCVHSSKE